MSDEYNAELDAALLKMQLVRLKAKVKRLERIQQEVRRIAEAEPQDRAILAALLEGKQQ